MTGEKRGPAIHELRLPDTLDDAGADEFKAASGILDTVVVDTWGNLDRAQSARSRLADWRPTGNWATAVFVAEDDGGIAGIGFCRLSLRDNLDAAWLHVDVPPGHRRKGVGTALLSRAEMHAAAHGRHIFQSSTEHPAGFADAGLLLPATGAGGIPAAASAAAFALRRGYALEQTSRFSLLDLTTNHDWTVLEADAADASARDYEVLTWTDRCPDGLVDQLAVLMGMMSTDSPAGGLEVEAEHWDSARVREVEATATAEGLTGLVAVARHRATGELAAYTTLYVDRERPWLGDQDDTLVIRRHRGHSLGMLVKLANLHRLRDAFPAVERVMTFNAEENEHMLAINVRLGFRPAGYDGEWQKRTT